MRLVPCCLFAAACLGLWIGLPVLEVRAQETGEKAPTATPDDVRELFDGRTLENWEIVQFGGQDDIRVIDGAIVARAGYPLAGIVWNGDELPVTNYRLELKAQKVDGTDFFCCLTFPVGEQHCSLVLGGWGGTVTGISCIDGEDAAHNATRSLHKYERGQWYTIRVDVRDDRIECWRDEERIVELPRAGLELTLRSEVLRTAPLGVCAFETESAWRNIRLTRLETGASGGEPGK